MKRKALWVGSFVVVALVAFLLGSAYGWRKKVETVQAMEKVGSMVGAAWASERAALLFHQAAYAEAREALISQVGILEELVSRPDLGWVSMAHSDLALAYMRLAVLEERKGNPAKSAEFTAKAEANARRAGWRDPSAVCIRRLVDRAEKNAP
ncbi:MAG TPA: hypothetical protein VMT45_13350 [Thermoanaerobaculaceae bacterium]|jgi:hypothetical protein|nr:hypothetical protein [Thermoanaerobaculaceae bacterium]